LVWHSAEPRHSFFVKVDAERVHRLQQDVQAKIKLEAVYEQGLGYILLHYKVLVRLDIVSTTRKEYTLALARVLWLTNEHLLLLVALLEGHLEVLVVTRQ
jgi:uncharacterized membrane protein YgdD (TMEM256/DUF423 family)